MLNKPLQIGITGGIGSGKSTVCQIFEVLGVPVYYSDDRANFLVQNDLGLRAEIINAFGEESFVNGIYNRSYIADLVFNNPDHLNKLNSIVHPIVALDYEKWVSDHPNTPYVLKEAALLLDENNRKGLDRIFVVTAPEELRIERVLSRDHHRTKEQIKAIISAQRSEKSMIALSDGVLDNSETLPLIFQVLKLHQSLL